MEFGGDADKDWVAVVGDDPDVVGVVDDAAGVVASGIWSKDVGAVSVLEEAITVAAAARGGERARNDAWGAVVVVVVVSEGEDVRARVSLREGSGGIKISWSVR